MISNDVLVYDMAYNAVPIVHFNYFTKVAELRAEVNLAYSQEELLGMHRPWQDGVQSTFDYNAPANDLETRNLPLLKQTIENAVTTYLEMLNPEGKAEIEIYESWINLYQPGAYQHFHIHSGSDISGCYYYDVPEGSGDIAFADHAKQTSQFPYNYTNIPLFQIRQSITPAPGSIVLFPSSAPHAVYQNTSSENRMSFAFNVSVRVL